MDKTDYTYKLNLRIFKDEKFFGDGVATLLENVTQAHSLRKASKNMNMAYTKSLQMIKRAENVLGYKLLISKAGGASGGGSYLTDNAKQLLGLYREFESKVKGYTDKEFEIFIKKMGGLNN